MKGIVHNMLADMVEERFGLDAWDAILDKAGSDGVFVATESYPDEDLMALVASASEVSGIEAHTLVYAFGQYMMPRFHESYPVFFKEGMRLRDFLESVDQVIHIEVRKLYPEANLPKFDYENGEIKRLTMLYRSPRKLCRLAEGLIDGAAAIFGESYHLQHDTCLHKGDDHCALVVGFDA